MNLYYVQGTVLSHDKKTKQDVEVTETRAVIARSLEHCEELCKEMYLRFEFPDPLQVFEMNKDWIDK